MGRGGPDQRSVGGTPTVSCMDRECILLCVHWSAVHMSLSAAHAVTYLIVLVSYLLFFYLPLAYTQKEKKNRQACSVLYKHKALVERGFRNNISF